jgi:hypothetical protein
MTVTKKTIRDGKSSSFDSLDDEWQQILLDALFGTGKSSIELSSQVSKNEDKLTVLKFHSTD